MRKIFLIGTVHLLSLHSPLNPQAVCIHRIEAKYHLWNTSGLRMRSSCGPQTRFDLLLGRFVDTIGVQCCSTSTCCRRTYYDMHLNSKNVITRCIWLGEEGRWERKPDSKLESRYHQSIDRSICSFGHGLMATGGPTAQKL